MGEDLEVVMGNGRALLRVADLMELADLVDRLSHKSALGRMEGCKVKYAANVKEITPHGGQNER